MVYTVSRSYMIQADWTHSSIKFKFIDKTRNSKNWKKEKPRISNAQNINVRKSGTHPRERNPNRSSPKMLTKNNYWVTIKIQNQEDPTLPISPRKKNQTRKTSIEKKKHIHWVKNQSNQTPHNIFTQHKPTLIMLKKKKKQSHSQQWMGMLGFCWVNLPFGVCWVGLLLCFDESWIWRKGWVS